MLSLEQLTPAQRASFSVERRVLPRSKIRLEFLERLADIATTHRGEVTDTDAHRVPLVFPHEVIGLQRAYPSLETKRVRNRTTSVCRMRGRGEIAGLGEHIEVKIGEVSLYELTNGQKILGASLEDEAGYVGRGRDQAAYTMSQIAEMPLRLAPQKPFLWLASVQEEGEAVDKLIDFASSNLPATTDLAGTRVYHAEPLYFPTLANTKRAL